MMCLQSLHSVGVVTIKFFNYMPYLIWYLSHIIILHGFCYNFFSFLILHGVCVVRIMGYAIGGGSYSSVYVPPPFYVFPTVLILHIPSFFFLFCILYTPFFSICTPMFSILPFVYFFMLG